MTGISATFDDAAVRASLNRMLLMGTNPQPLLRMVARIGESQTKERFTTERDPDGNPWKPSMRVAGVPARPGDKDRDIDSAFIQPTGGKTLTLNGILGNSITSQATVQYAEWGTNVQYAAAQNYGATITPKNGRALAFHLPNGAFVLAGSVTLPARRFMGVSNDDAKEILASIAAKIKKLEEAA